jgi:hypothetical protein
MNNAWRPIIGSVAAIAATIWAATLLALYHYPSRAAAALLIGAALVALILSQDLLSNLISRFSQDYKGGVATVVSVGGGATVAFALVWILLAVTGFTIRCDNNCTEISDTISLPLIVIVGVAVLLISISLVTFTFSVIGLSSARDALGLPDGSVRAIIALMLLVLFSIMAIFLYNNMGERRVLSLDHVSEQALNDMRSRVAIIHQEAEPPPAQNTYKVTYHEINNAADDLAKQLVVMLGTLVTAVAAFYFGSASVTSASAVILGQRLTAPLVTSISPSPIIASGQAQSLVLVGSNLGGVKKVHLERKGESDIDAASVDGKDGLLTAQITIPKDKTGIWNVVVNDGQQAVTIATLELKPDVAAPSTQAQSAARAEIKPADLSAMPPAAPIAGAAAPVAASPVPRTINKGFLGHGLFLEYRPITTLQRYASYGGASPDGATTAQLIERFIKAVQNMHMASVWIQLFSASGTLDSGHGATTELVAALKEARIACVGWGYCYSGNAENDADLAKQLCGNTASMPLSPTSNRAIRSTTSRTRGTRMHSRLSSGPSDQPLATTILASRRLEISMATMTPRRSTSSLSMMSRCSHRKSIGIKNRLRPTPSCVSIRFVARASRTRWLRPHRPIGKSTGMAACLAIPWRSRSGHSCLNLPVGTR